MAQLFEPEEIHLSNDIPVVLQHYEGPVASTYWWVQTGSADEGRSEEGFAHFLEHMLFKDAAAKETGIASSGQIARSIESLGGDINAYTSFDQTVYHVTCASHHWEKVIDAFGTMAKPQKFLKSDFEREREVILEELRKNEDAPGRQLFQHLFSQTFKRHPYGRPVIGYAKTLKAARVSNLESFYRRRYASTKMGLILVGPFRDMSGARKKSLIKALEKRFGSQIIPKRSSGSELERPLDKPLSSSETPKVEVLPFDVKTPTLCISFRAPKLLDEDTPALELLSGILGMGELSRLYQRLFYQTSIATDASGALYTPRDPGMLYFQAEVPSMDQVTPAFRELLLELERLKREGPTRAELDRVIVNVESEKLYATQSADGMAGRLGFLRFVLGDMAYDHKFVERLRAIDEAAIRAIAATYLDPKRMSGVLLVPKEHAGFDSSEIGKMARDILGTASQAKGTVLKSTTKPGNIPHEVLRLPNGIQVCLSERPHSHVFSVYAATLGGLRLEAPDAWGASNLFAQTWSKGTRQLSARQISAIVEGSAASLDGFSGRNSIGLQMTGLERDWGKLSQLFSEVLTSPSFPKDEVDHSRRVVEDSIRGIEDHSSQLCSKLFLETLFERHPYGKMPQGSLESVAGIDEKKLLALHDHWIRPERLCVAVSGPIRREAIEAWLRELGDRFDEMRRNGTASTKAALDEEPRLNAPRWIEKHLGREQTHIIVGGLGTKITSDDRHALRLMQNVLGGQSGRLFIELREKKSLAYTVAPVSFEGLERGYVGTYIACSPSKKDEAISGIREVLEKLAQKGPSPSETRRAKEFFLGRHAMDMQGDSSIATSSGLELLYGIPHLDESALIKKIESITAKEIQRVCREYLVEPFMVTSVVG